MDSQSRNSRYDSDDGHRSSRDKISHKRRDRSPYSEDRRSPRRRRHSSHRDKREPHMNESDDETSRHRRKSGRDDRSERGDRSRRDRTKDYSDDERRSSRRDRKYRSRSRSRSHSRSRSRTRHTRHDDDRSHRRSKTSRSPYSSKKPRSVSPPAATKKSRAPLPSQDESFRGDNANLPPGTEKPTSKQKPNFRPTGLLAKEANTVTGTTTVLKYHEPPEARKPPSTSPWRLYTFKGSQEILSTTPLHTRSAWLLGRDPSITDIHLSHPSISKQHAVIQFRHRTSVNEYGDKRSKVKPYLIDLESANGTKVNGKRVEARRYVELLDQDVLAFGDSEREYVMMLPGAEKEKETEKEG